MSKRTKHPVYDDPTAFKMRFPRIEAVDGASGMKLIAREQMYKMGPVRASVTVPQEGVPGYFMSVHGRDRYPTWDEIVWLRYNLIPDAAVMMLMLPNLNRYINKEDAHHKYVFTMQQNGWVLDPPPTCRTCGGEMKYIGAHLTTGVFSCDRDHVMTEIDMATWNEEHGNGFLGRLK